jgi:hypothetical protein
MKVSEKGAVSIYGMGRFPVTTVAEAAGHVGRHSRVHWCDRSAIEDEGLKMNRETPLVPQFEF